MDTNIWIFLTDGGILFALRTHLQTSIKAVVFSMSTV